MLDNLMSNGGVVLQRDADDTMHQACERQSGNRDTYTWHQKAVVEVSVSHNQEGGLEKFDSHGIY